MTIRCHCVSSFFCPSRSVNRSVVARLTVATGVPPAVNRISASRPRLPTRIALLTLPMADHPTGTVNQRWSASLDPAELLQHLCGLQGCRAVRIFLSHQLVVGNRVLAALELLVRNALLVV